MSLAESMCNVCLLELALEDDRQFDLLPPSNKKRRGTAACAAVEFCLAAKAYDTMDRLVKKYLESDIPVKYKDEIRNIVGYDATST